MAATEQQDVSSRNGWADSKTAWKRRNRHNITLPTGMNVTVKFPDTGTLIRTGGLPHDLIHIVFLDEFAPDKLKDVIGDPEQEAALLANASDLAERLAVEMLIDPKVTLEELHVLPSEDLDMLKQIAMRERNTDAVGRVLGVAPLDLFTTFREAHEGSEDVAEGHPPWPDPGCEFCVDAMRAFSSLRELQL